MGKRHHYEIYLNLSKKALYILYKILLKCNYKINNNGKNSQINVNKLRI